jgi:hypothetical protein
MVNVYYDQMTYTKVEDEPTLGVDVLIALIGGNLGLFWGASLLTLVEIIEIIFYTIYLGLKHRKD